MHWRLLALLLFLLLTTTPVVCVFFSFKKSIMMVILANSLRVLLCKWDTQKWRIYSARWRWPCFFVFFSTGRSIDSVVVVWSCKRHKYLQLGWRTGPTGYPHNQQLFIFWERLYCTRSVSPILLYLGSILVRGIIIFFFWLLVFCFVQEIVEGRVGCVAPPTWPSYSTRRLFFFLQLWNPRVYLCRLL
jgi:hypothetical protein